ncbi:Vacuolar protein sorting-associated protein [Zalerion maritima]|uniref:Vacuolar protein sorting-associated protein n=1 Tax=Zalerion maritima TaxID=339359 RepID=A0AAD5WR12_9PEZI|nr:Vacuolar protein sorting-associated protein [Zalerion maritima]
MSFASPAKALDKAPIFDFATDNDINLVATPTHLPRDKTSARSIPADPRLSPLSSPLAHTASYFPGIVPSSLFLTMAATLPASLKAADLTRFAHRASQLEKFKPVVAYWCEYWIVNQILAQSLHQADGEALEYTTTLMDKLETTKREHAGNAAITDDGTGKAACIKFAQETFDRAERAIDANKVTRQTADTFQAAATFFELQNIWGSPDRETQAKIKYAKWNAARIFKAIREGKDPNETNPRRGEEEEEAKPEDGGLPSLDPNDPEVRMLMGSGGAASTSASPVGGVVGGDMGRAPSQPFMPPMPRPVTIEHAPGHGYQRPNSAGVSPLEPQVSAPTSPLPSALPSAPDQVSPLAPPELPEPTTPGSYFPSMPAGAHPPKMAPPEPPAAAARSPPMDFYRTTPSQPSPPPLHFVDTAPSHPIAHNQQPPSSSFSPVPTAPTPVQYSASSAHHQHAPRLSPPPVNYQQNSYPPPQPAQPTYRSNPQPQQQPPQQHQQYYQHQPHQPQPDRYTTDDVKMAEAQKHARWAISALNFEDVGTAVRELKTALGQLLE